MPTLSPTLAWHLLIGVRERRRDVAQDTLRREQQATAQREHEVQQTEAAWRAQLAARDTHAQAMRERFVGGAASVAQLRQGGAWDGTLAQRIGTQQRALAEARARLAQQQEVLAEARRALLKANAELDQAREMQAKSRRAQRHVAELRVEDALDEAGAQAWQAARQRRAGERMAGPANGTPGRAA